MLLQSFPWHCWQCSLYSCICWHLRRVLLGAASLCNCTCRLPGAVLDVCAGGHQRQGSLVGGTRGTAGHAVRAHLLGAQPEQVVQHRLRRPEQGLAQPLGLLARGAGTSAGGVQAVFCCSDHYTATSHKLTRSQCTNLHAPQRTGTGNACPFLLVHAPCRAFRTDLQIQSSSHPPHVLVPFALGAIVCVLGGAAPPCMPPSTLPLPLSQ